MTQNPGQPGQSNPPTAKSAAAIDALDALARGEQSSSPPPPAPPGEMVDGIAMTVAPSGAPPAELILAAGGTMEQADVPATPNHPSHLAGEGRGGEAAPVTPGAADPVGQPAGGLEQAASWPDPGTTFTLSGPNTRRKRRTGFSPGWRYAIPPLAAMATAMFIISGWAILMLAHVAPSKVNSPLALSLLLAGGLLLGTFLLMSCFMIHKDIARQQQRQQAQRERQNSAGNG